MLTKILNFEIQICFNRLLQDLTDSLGSFQLLLLLSGLDMKLDIKLQKCIFCSLDFQFSFAFLQRAQSEAAYLHLDTEVACP